MATEVAFSDLNTWLSARANNTPQTPYEITITGLTVANLRSSEETGTLGHLLRSQFSSHREKLFVDISTTQLPSELTDMTNTFYRCKAIVYAPSIPSNVNNVFCTFLECSYLQAAPAIPNGIESIAATFSNCTRLQMPPVIPNSVLYMPYTFDECNQLLVAPTIPNGVINITACFYGCEKITETPTLPSGITDMTLSFGRCISLHTITNIPSNVTSLEGSFMRCTSLTEPPTIPSSVTNLQKAFMQSGILVPPTIPNNVTNMKQCFYGCTSIVSAPVIPEGVTDISDCFSYSTIESVPYIPSTITNATNAFLNCSNLKKIERFGISLNTLVNNSNFKDMFSGCTTLECVGNKPEEASDWHIFRIKLDTNTITGKIYDKTGSSTTITTTSISKTTIKFPILTDELLFTSTISDADLDALIEDVLTYKYTYTGDSTSVINPKHRSFVLWADDEDRVVTNLSFPADVSHASGVLPIANGGTGRTTAPNIQVNLASTSSVSELPATGDVAPGVTGTLPVANGGTGQTTLALARNAMGLGNTTGALPVANGGTGQTTAGEAATALLTGLPDWTAIPTDTTKLIRRDTNGTASFGQVQFSTVCDYLKGKWTYRTEGTSTKLKININSTSAWMLCFVVTLYQGYRATKIMVSGYHYSSGSNIWYEPEAVILGDSNAAETISVYFGYDSATNLWVGFDGGNYTGLVISDVANGYKAISNYYNLFTISNVSSFGGTTQKTVTARAYSSYLYGLVGRAVKDYVTLDLSTLDASKWYPVTFDLSLYGFTEMECYVSLNSGTKPSWSTHANGFSCHLHLLTMGCGWGTTAGQTIVLDRNYSFSNVVPVGWTQMTNSSTGVLWLRGGGKYYAWNNRGNAFTIRTSDYTINSQTVSPTTTYQWSFAYATMSVSIDGSANNVDGYHADTTSTNNLIRVTRGSDPGASKVGYYAGMTSINAGDGATKWWHILSMDWSGSTDNPTTWTSQLLLPTEQGGTPKYRRNNTGGTAIGSSTWHSFITDENIASQSVSTATTANKIRTSNSNPSDGDIWIQ